MTYDSSDPRDVEKVIKEVKTKEVLRKDGLRQLMGTEPGRAWLYNLIEICGPGQNPFSTDALRMAFACGELNIGNQIVGQCNALAPELYLVMMKENSNG